MRAAGRTALAIGGLPGEQVVLAPAGRRGGASLLHVTEVIEASPYRIEPSCPYADRCGGCACLHVAPAHRIDLKRSILGDCLARVGGFTPHQFKVKQISGPMTGWRRKALFHVASGRVGFRRLGSRRLVSIDSCAMLVDPINRLLPALSGLSDIERLEAVAVLSGDQGLSLHVRCSDPVMPDELFRSLSGVGVRHLSVTFAGRTEERGGPVGIEVDGTVLRAKASVFFQGNAPLLPELVREVVRASLPVRMKGRLSAWDLHAGVGLFSAFLVQAGYRVTAVESNEPAIPLLHRNVGRNGRVQRGTDFRFLSQGNEPPDLLVLDPPRSGMPTQARRAAVIAGARSVALVACDPAVFAGLLRDFAREGYSVDGIALLDLFPGTYQMELVGRLTKSAAIAAG